MQMKLSPGFIDLLICCKQGNAGFTLHDFQSHQIVAFLTQHDSVGFQLVAVVCTLHNGSGTGDTLYTISQQKELPTSLHRLHTTFHNQTCTRINA